MEKFKFSSGKFNADIGVEVFDISKKSPVPFQNGMSLYHNLNFNIKLDLDQTYRDFRDMPVETPNENKNLGPVILDND